MKGVIVLKVLFSSSLIFSSLFVGILLRISFFLFFLLLLRATGIDHVVVTGRKGKKYISASVLCWTKVRTSRRRTTLRAIARGYIFE